MKRIFNSKQLIGFLGSGEHARELQIMFTDTHSIIFNAIDKQFISSSSNEIDVSSADQFFKFPVIAAVGNPHLKKQLIQAWQNSHFTNLISNKAIMNLANNSLGIGITIADAAVLTSGITLRDHVSINIGSSISHDVYIDEFTTVSPKVAIGGGSYIGKNCFLGIGSIVIDHVNICDEVIIGAGAVVTRDICSPGTYVGIPARKISD